MEVSRHRLVGQSWGEAVAAEGGAGARAHETGASQSTGARLVSVQAPELVVVRWRILQPNCRVLRHSCWQSQV